MSDELKNRDRRPGAGLTRREALQLTLAAGVSATSITLLVTDPAEAARNGVFLHGVASGDPQGDRVIIWTRVTRAGSRDDIPVQWTVAEDAGLRNVVRSGTAQARAFRDFTVKIDVGGLEPGRRYFYQFKAAGDASPVGRTRTLPDVGVEQLKLAVFSCSNYELGYFNAYREAARHDDLDAVLHLGDYIYEYGPGPGGFTTPAHLLGLAPKPRDADLVPTEEIIVLEQYRARHALYRTDADLQKIHRLNPFINIWDDHEVANDSWTGGAENHSPETEGMWQARKEAGIRAFYEWLPIREPADGERIDPVTRNPDALYRAFDFGDLARVIMLDTREAARDLQLDTQGLLAAYAGAPAEGPFPNDLTKVGTKRTLMGSVQQDWLNEQIAGSTQPWQLIGNQVLMFYQATPDVLGSTVLSAAEKAQFLKTLDQLLGAGAGDLFARLGAAGLPFPLAADAWTGYPTARVRMLKALAKAANPIVLTGDSHNAWTANLKQPTARGPKTVGVEFGGTSVSSPGYEQYLLGVDPDQISALFVESSANRPENDDLIYAEQSERGFMLVTVRPAAVLVDYVFVSTVFETTYSTRTQRFRVPVGRKTATIVS